MKFAEIIRRIEEIHDEACHVLGTESRGGDYKSTVQTDARTIKRLAREILDAVK